MRKKVTKERALCGQGKVAAKVKPGDTHCAYAYANIFQCEAAANVETIAAGKATGVGAARSTQQGQKEEGHRPQEQTGSGRGQCKLEMQTNAAAKPARHSSFLAP